MNDLVNMVKVMFGFTEFRFIITILGILLLLGSFFGGLLFNIIRAHGRPRKDLLLKERISFRLHLLSLLFVVLYALYYHLMIIGKISFPQIAYWGCILALAPALASFGAQITYVIFGRQIEANRTAYRDWVIKKSDEKAAKVREATQAEAERMAAEQRKVKMDAEIDAKIAHARKTHKIG